MQHTSISKEANPNYLAKVFYIVDIKKHPNADKLQIVTVDGVPIITGLEAKVGMPYVYFPVESAINKDFLAFTDSFSKSSLNSDVTQKGFFANSGRVKAVKLRGEYSMGYIIPIKVLYDFTDLFDWKANEEFDSVADILILKKYEVNITKQQNVNKQGRNPQISKLIDGQVHLHVDTQNLRKNVHKLSPSDTVSITYKTHGTSFWVSNVLTKVKPKWWHKPLSWLPLQRSKYEVLYGSRNVVKNSYYTTTSNTYYSDDLYKTAMQEFASKLPKGFSIYGEILGFTPSGSFIQKPYDYGCNPYQCKYEVYRVTHTTSDGDVTELSYPQMKEFCTKHNIPISHLMFYGTVESLSDYLVGGEYNLHIDYLVAELERTYNEKDCFMCNTKLPEEGIVLRKESLYSCESYKLKSLRFLERETKQLDEESKDDK